MHLLDVRAGRAIKDQQFLVGNFHGAEATRCGAVFQGLETGTVLFPSLGTFGGQFFQALEKRAGIFPRLGKKACFGFQGLENSARQNEGEQI